MSDPRRKGGLARSTALHLILIIAFGLIAYANTFDVPFQFDDDPNIANNIFIKDTSYFTGFLADKHSSLDVFLKSRYVGYFTFALNWRANGLDVRGYHAANLTIHLINAVLIYCLVLLTLRTPGLAESGLHGNSRPVALIAALLFVSHPIQTQAVTYIVQRFASLATLFYIMSVVLYARARLSRGKASALTFITLSLVSAVLAMKTKEIAFTLPLTIALYEIFFLSGSLKKRMLHLFPLLLTLLIIPLTMLGSQSSAVEVINGSRLATEMSRLDYLFTEFRVIVTYIRLLLLPVNQNLDYAYPVNSSIAAPSVLISFLLLIAALGSAIFALHRSRKSEPALKLVSFGIFWFFISISVESSIIPIADVIFEHRVYLPSAGAFMAAATGAAISVNRIKWVKLRTAAAVLILTIPFCLTAAAYNRNAVWSSDLSLWSDVVEKAPGNARGQYNVGLAYEEENHLNEAVMHYRKALEIRPEFLDARNNLAIVYRKLGQNDLAIKQYLLLTETNPEEVRPHYNLGNAYRDKGLLDKAEEQYLIAIKLMPDLVEAHMNLGVLYHDKGMLDAAITQYRQAISLRPGNPSVRKNLAGAYLEQGHLDQSISESLEALRFSPDDPATHYILAKAYEAKGLNAKAAEHFRIAEDLRKK